MKLLKTILLSVTFLSAFLLWLTRSEWMPSLSSFALSENVVFYRFMHLSMSWFFLINALEFKKYATEFVLALLVGCILAFDMYHHHTLHLIFTAATVLLCCFTLLFNVNKGLNSTFAMICVVGAVGTFAVGYFVEAFHFLLAEVICMAFLSAGKLKEIHKTIT
jgi:hypothetical protein